MPSANTCLVPRLRHSNAALDNGYSVAYQNRMAINDKSSERLYVEAALSGGAHVTLSADHVHYLSKVLRARAGDGVLLFNGRDGEWRGALTLSGKRGGAVILGEQTRPQASGPDLMYLFAPLKRSRLDYMIQKATELGVARLSPVMTRRTIAERVNLDRMRANAIEAAEQCGVLWVPAVDEPQDLARLLASWPDDRVLIFADEAAEVASPLDALAPARGQKLGLLIGPEGGFANEERSAITRVPRSIKISLGPRVMRADTAAVAALALINAVAGDWR